MRSAIKYSVLWYYRELAKGVGEARMKEWVTKLGYGNQDTSGGIDQFWLRSSLRISADEQIEFLKKLYREQLPVSKRSLETAHQLDQTNSDRPGLPARAMNGSARFLGDERQC
jgi:beta-lactamase class D